VELDQLRQIIELLKAEGLSEITVCEGDQRITVRQGSGAAAVLTASMPAPASAAEAPQDDETTFTVSAPLVGTFYRRSSQGADPFVSPGDIVNPGDALCVIEAMKVMNEINAGRPGRVRRVLVEDGEAVEYGQALFLLERL